MIAETLAGIALVKSAVDGIKSAIGTANDISEIAGHIDKLFEGEKQVQQQRSKKAGTGLTDQFGINSVAQEMIDARLAQEKITEMRNLVDMRFGPGTWKGIVDERARRIQEAKEVAAVARRAEIQRRNEIMENVKIGITVAAVIAVAIGFLAFAMVASALTLIT